VTPEKSIRIAVFSKTLAFSLTYLLAIVVIHRFYLVPRMPSRALSLAMAIALVQCAAIGVMLGFSFVWKLAGQWQAARAASVLPRIRELLALQAAGSDGGAEIRRLAKTHRREFEQCLLECLHIVRGQGREALSQLAADLGWIQKWHQQCRSWSAPERKNAIAHLTLVSRTLASEVVRAALLDRDESVRLHTARAILRSPETGEVTQVFRMAIGASLMTRWILAEDLRPYALELARDPIATVLASAAIQPVLATLEIVRAWGKFLPLPELYPLLRHGDPAVRAAAVSLLPLVPRLPQLESNVLDALQDSEEQVRSAAARTAAALGIQSALPLLARCLHDSDARTAASAAYALAQLGTEGCHVLEQEVLTDSFLAATAALEALERARSSPAETTVAG
jgi:hypothetical protein